MFKTKNDEQKFEMEEKDRQIPDKLFELAMACSFDAFMITTAEKSFPIVYVNQAFTQITGYAQHECVGRSPSFLQGPKTDREVIKRLSENIRSGATFHGEAINYHKDGSEFIMEWKVIGYTNEKGQVSHYIAIQKDVTKLRGKAGHFSKPQP
jgi:PAS domain S-box-containing protein